MSVIKVDLGLQTPCSSAPGLKLWAGYRAFYLAVSLWGFHLAAYAANKQLQIRSQLSATLYIAGTGYTFCLNSGNVRA